MFRINMLFYFYEAFRTFIKYDLEKKNSTKHQTFAFTLTSPSYHIWEIFSQISPHGVKLCVNRWTLHLVLKVRWLECGKFGSKSLSKGLSHKKSFIYFNSSDMKGLGFLQTQSTARFPKNSVSNDDDGCEGEKHYIFKDFHMHSYNWNL